MGATVDNAENSADLFNIKVVEPTVATCNTPRHSYSLQILL